MELALFVALLAFLVWVPMPFGSASDASQRALILPALPRYPPMRGLRAPFRPRDREPADLGTGPPGGHCKPRSSIHQCDVRICRGSLAGRVTAAQLADTGAVWRR